MALFRPRTSRRREIRRSLPRTAPLALPAMGREDALWTILFILVFTIVAGVVSPVGSERTQYAPGQLLPEAVVARVQFAASDEARTRDKRADAFNREPAVYDLNEALFRELADRLYGLAQLASDPNIDSLDDIPPQFTKSLQLTPEAFAALKQFVEAGKPSPAWQQTVREYLHGRSGESLGLAGLAILPPEQFNEEQNPEQRPPRIVIRHPQAGDLDRNDNVLLSTGGDARVLQERLDSILERLTLPPPIRPAVIAVTLQTLQPVAADPSVRAEPQPTYRRNDEETRLRRQRAFDQTPAHEITYRVNDVLVPAGKRLESSDLLLIARERQAYHDQLSQAHPLLALLQNLARLGLIALIGTAVWAYILAYNPRIARNPMRGAALTGLLLLALTLATGSTLIDPRFQYVGVAFSTLMAGMILAIAYDRRFALAVAAVHALLVVLTLDLGIDLLIAQLAGLAVAIGLLNEVRTRSKLLLTGLWSGVAMAVAAFVTGAATRPLIFPDQMRQVLIDALVSLGAGVGTGIVVQSLLPAIEKLFRVTTSLTLKELIDASHPLLRQLAQEAPGTYQHSLRIADMAESAADAVAADGLLCKVGALYHDIGKMNKPLYFVENQGGGPNRHEKLSPAMSLLIIVGHVKDGVEMAREFALPPNVRHFIESHHGTTLVEYFYHAARKRREAEDEPAPSEFEFRYPGPKPQTREAAILMLCDSIEGAARTLTEPSPARFEQLVRRISHKRLLDGQFNECHLTLQELHRIEQAIIKTLCAMYHGRIAYPSDAERGGAGNGDRGAPRSTVAAS